MNPENWLTAKKAVEKLNESREVSRSTFFRWVQEKKIKKRKKGSIYLYSEASIQELLAKLSHRTPNGTVSETPNETVLHKTTNETPSETPKKIFATQKNIITLEKEIFIYMQKQAYDNGKNKAELLLTEGQKRLELENTTLKKDNEVLDNNLKREQKQKWITIGLIICLIISWIIYSLIKN
jgi:hypothetical protein